MVAHRVVPSDLTRDMMASSSSLVQARRPCVRRFGCRLMAHALKKSMETELGVYAGSRALCSDNERSVWLEFSAWCQCACAEVQSLQMGTRAGS